MIQKKRSQDDEIILSGRNELCCNDEKGLCAPRRIVAYSRVSTVSQDLDNQKLGIIEFAKKEKLDPLTFIDERVSGTTPVKERKLQQVIDTLQKDDVLIVAELSRLGRNMVETLTVVEELVEKGVKVYAVKGGYRMDGSLNSKILSMVLCMASEIERDLISQRTREAIARRKLEGKPVGRPKGSYGVSKLDKHKGQIQEMIGKGVGIASIAKIFDATWATVNVFCKRRGIRPPRKHSNA